MTRRRAIWLGAAAALTGAALWAAYSLGLLFPHRFTAAEAPLVTPTGAQTAPEAREATSAGRLNILLLGIDARTAGEQTRSDILLLLSIDPENRDPAMLAIPRDSRVLIPGHGLDKINHAHAFGGMGLTLQTVSDLLELPIHHWVRIDMPNFIQLMDLIGTVRVQVPYPLTLADGSRLSAGEQLMDSQQALLYLRERYSDPQGDLGRSSRAQRFLIDLVLQLRDGLTPADLPRAYGLMKEHVATDMTFREISALAQLGRESDLAKVKQGRLVGRGVEDDGIFYLELDQAETERILQTLGLRPDGKAHGAGGGR